MAYALAADLVVVVHAAFVVFAGLGGLLALRWRWIPWVHIPAACWAGFVEISNRVCPLTPVENSLRQAAGTRVYTGDFIEHYVEALLYPSDLTRQLQIGLAATLVVLNVAAYAFVWHRRAGR